MNLPEMNLKLSLHEIKPPKVSLEKLLNAGFLKENERFYDKNQNFICYLVYNNKVSDNKEILSIHKMAVKYLNKANHNDWSYFYILKDEKLISIDALRYAYENNKSIL